MTPRQPADDLSGRLRDGSPGADGCGRWRRSPGVGTIDSGAFAPACGRRRARRSRRGGGRRPDRQRPDRAGCAGGGGAAAAIGAVRLIGPDGDGVDLLCAPAMPCRRGADEDPGTEQLIARAERRRRRSGIGAGSSRRRRGHYIMCRRCRNAPGGPDIVGRHSAREKSEWSRPRAARCSPAPAHRPASPRATPVFRPNPYCRHWLDGRAFCAFAALGMILFGPLSALMIGGSDGSIEPPNIGAIGKGARGAEHRQAENGRDEDQAATLAAARRFLLVVLHRVGLLVRSLLRLVVILVAILARAWRKCRQKLAGLVWPLAIAGRTRLLGERITARVLAQTVQARRRFDGPAGRAPAHRRRRAPPEPDDRPDEDRSCAARRIVRRNAVRPARRSCPRSVDRRRRRNRLARPGSARRSDRRPANRCPRPVRHRPEPSRVLCRGRYRPPDRFGRSGARVRRADRRAAHAPGIGTRSDAVAAAERAVIVVGHKVRPASGVTRYRLSLSRNSCPKRLSACALRDSCGIPHGRTTASRQAPRPQATRAPTRARWQRLVQAQAAPRLVVDHSG